MCVRTHGGNVSRSRADPVTPSDIPAVEDIDWHKVAGNMAQRRSSEGPGLSDGVSGNSGGKRGAVRTAFDCRIQYEHWDHPCIDDGPWTKAEELVLLTLDKTGVGIVSRQETLAPRSAQCCTSFFIMQSSCRCINCVYTACSRMETFASRAA